MNKTNVLEAAYFELVRGQFNAVSELEKALTTLRKVQQAAEEKYLDISDEDLIDNEGVKIFIPKKDRESRILHLNVHGVG